MQENTIMQHDESSIKNRKNTKIPCHHLIQQKEETSYRKKMEQCYTAPYNIDYILVITSLSSTTHNT